jgi:oxalate decarboxylase/phosphoglucose isomerase-like protein (cupin superfamily)
MNTAHEEQMNYVPKGWGSELWIWNDVRYCGKLLRFDSGKKCSLHYHKLKHETFYLQSGRLKVLLCPLELFARSYVDGDCESWLSIVKQNNGIHDMSPGDRLVIEPLMVHQMIAEAPSELFEFSTQHFDDDSYRLLKGD